MTIKDVLRGTIVMFEKCHVMGSESETFSAALGNLKELVRLMDEKGSEAENEDHVE